MLKLSRFTLTMWLVAATFIVAGCTGDTGPMGPEGAPGNPGDPGGPLKILFCAIEGEQDLIESMDVASAEGWFPLGTELDYFHAINVVPTLDLLTQFDAVLAYAATPAMPDQLSEDLGDVLADYVDAGGGLVITQAAFQTLPVRIGGRIMTEGYAPFIPGPVSGDINNRNIDPASLARPLHPMFNGIDINAIHYLHQPQFSLPEMDSTATMIAMDDGTPPGPAIAVNARGNIFGTRMFGDFGFNPEFFAESYHLIGNMLVVIAQKSRTGDFDPPVTAPPAAIVANR